MGRSALILQLAGELDGAMAKELERHLCEIRAARPEALLMDLLDVDLVDAVTAALILRTRTDLLEAGTDVRIATRGQPRRLLSIAGLDQTVSPRDPDASTDWAGSSG